MEKYIVVEHNIETDEILEREMTAEETAKIEADIANSEAAAQEKAAAAAAKSALLAQLGITEDQAKLLLS